MTQFEILNLAYDAAAERWNHYKELADEAREAGRNSEVWEHKEKEFWNKVKEINKMIAAIEA